MERDEFLRMFSARLRDIQEEMEITRAQMSEMTGVSKASIDNYMVGRADPTAHILMKLCAGLSVQPGFFLGMPDVDPRTVDLLYESNVELTRFAVKAWLAIRGNRDSIPEYESIEEEARRIGVTR